MSERTDETRDGDRDGADGTAAGGVLLPPQLRTSDGRDRRVGVEIEFGDLPVAEAARIVGRRFSGAVTEHDRHRFTVETQHGDFVVELDTQYAHPAPRDRSRPENGFEKLMGDLDTEASGLIGDLSTGFVPGEIAAPPIPIAGLAVLDELVADLRAAGATGTDEGAVYAFGLQYNPEVVDEAPAYILSVLRAFLLLADWLRRGAARDPLRNVLPFARPFHRDYALRILDPGYRPDMKRLIDDYLAANPTRNRELDMLPLFAHLDRERVQSMVRDVRIKARPTFHYRLPDARYDEPGETGPVVREWNRWVEVERLADDPDRLADMATAYRRHFDRLIRFAGDWAEDTERWLTGAGDGR